MENKKTPEQWFQKLKEPYRSEAIANIDTNYNDYEVMTKNLDDALGSSFDWEKSTQGHNYWEQIYNSIVSGETTYLEPETLKPEQMESGKWYVVTNRFDKDYLVKVIKVDNEYFYIEKGVILEDGTPEPEKKLELSRLKNYRYAVSDLVLKYFPDEVFEDVSLINEVNNSQVTEQQNQNWSEKVELRPEDLVSGEVYTFSLPKNNWKWTFKFKCLNLEKTHDQVEYYRLYVHHDKEIIIDSSCSHREKYYHATPEEKALLLGEEQTELEKVKKLLEESNRLYALKEIELTKLQEKFDELQAKFNQLEPKGEKVYFYVNKEGQFQKDNKMDNAIDKCMDRSPIYEAVCIGKKKSVLVSE